MASLSKQIEVLSPLFFDSSASVVQQLLLDRHDVQTYENDQYRIYKVLGESELISGIYTFGNQTNRYGLLEKLRRLLAFENKEKTVEIVSGERDQFRIGNELIDIPRLSVVSIFDSTRELPLPEGVQQLVKRVSNYLPGEFYYGFGEESTDRIMMGFNSIMIYLPKQHLSMLKRLSFVNWAQMAPDASSSEVTVDEITFDKRQKVFEWRNRVSVLMFVGGTLVVGPWFERCSESAMDTKPWSLKLKVSLAIVGAICLLVDYFLRKRTLLLETNGIKIKCGIITLKNVPVSKINRVDVKRHITNESSEVVGPETSEYNVMISTRDLKSIRLLKGLTERQAHFIARNINEYMGHEQR